jgi:predicted dehydrogenase
MAASSDPARADPVRADPIRFAMIGSGWRAEFFLCVARALPERFQVSAVLVRDQSKHAAFEARWGVPAFNSLEPVLASNPSFVVLSVPREVAPDWLEQLARLGMPALCETPPAADLEGLIRLHRLTEQGARIQVAEQYAFQPMHAARLGLAHSGKLGKIVQAHVSVAHDYHGLNLIRRFLGIGFQNCTITAQAFDSSVIQGPGRDGPPNSETLEREQHVVARLDFVDRLGVYDFTYWSPYFSWIRSQRLLVQGTHGEIHDETMRYLKDFRTPIQLELRRVDTGHGGNLEGHHHVGVLAGSDWAYRNPFAPARLSDDEIAVAACLQDMSEYVAGGPGFYGLPDASQDQYLTLMMQQALETGQPVMTATQVWS